MFEANNFYVFSTDKWAVKTKLLNRKVKVECVFAQQENPYNLSVMISTETSLLRKIAAPVQKEGD